MPNHITNELTAPAEVIAALVGPESAVDFEQVTPMPEIMRGVIAGHIQDWAKIATGHTNLPQLFSARHADPLASFQRRDYGAASDALRVGIVDRLLREGPFPKDFGDEDFERWILAMRALRQYGVTDWYDWSIEHWGTKWNAYDVKPISATQVKFQTAWSAPLPIIHALSRRFLGAQIQLRWADEDFGSNTGDVTVMNGLLVSGGRLRNQSEEANVLAFELVHGNQLPEECVAFDPVRGLQYQDDDEAGEENAN